MALTYLHSSLNSPSIFPACCTTRSADVEIMEDLFQVAGSALALARAQAVEFAVADEGSAGS